MNKYEKHARETLPEDYIFLGKEGDFNLTGEYKFIDSSAKAISCEENNDCWCPQPSISIWFEFYYCAHKDSEIVKLNGLQPKKNKVAAKPSNKPKAEGDIYVMCGEPNEWCEIQPMGPFTSGAKACKAIREDCQNSLESDDKLKLGTQFNYFEKYTIVKIVKSFQPVAKVRADVTLKNV